MTAEVCVMNTIGIALATDSAVSIGGNGFGKIYNSANKLFALSKTEPVGIMIYGSAEYMNVPWETVIKTYRKTIENIKFDTLEEYADSFIKYITENPIFNNKDSEIRSILNICEVFIKEIIDNDLADLIIAGVENEMEPDYAKEFEEFIHDRIHELSHIETLIKEPILFNRFKKDYTELIRGLLEGNLFFPFNENILKHTIRCIYLLIIKNIFPNQYHTGVVFSGFGEKDFFPKLIEYSIGSTFYGHLKIYKEETISINNTYNSARAAIIPFAQNEMVYTFLNGIDEHLLTQINYNTLNSINSLFDEIILPHLDETLTDEEISDIKMEYISKTLQQISNSNDMYIYDNNKAPILNILPTFPKEELAVMAETLVNLTSFKRKVSQELETVGGPIDVAIITKGDGFIWVKRKLYFDKNLNHDYFSNR